MARSTTTQEIAEVAEHLGVKVESDVDWGVETVVQSLLLAREQVISVHEATRLLGRASVVLDDEYDGGYTVWDKILRAIDLA